MPKNNKLISFVTSLILGASLAYGLTLLPFRWTIIAIIGLPLLVIVLAIIVIVKEGSQENKITANSDGIKLPQDGFGIVLTSQVIGDAEGFQVHGIFPSFPSAARHVAKDVGLSFKRECELLTSWRNDNDTQVANFDRNDLHEHWCASIQPIRNESGI